METPWTSSEELVASRIAELHATADRVRFARRHARKSWLRSFRRHNSQAAAVAPTTSGTTTPAAA